MGEEKIMDFELLKNSMADLEEDTVIDILNEVMAKGGKDAETAVDALQEGMKIIGDRFDEGEYFVADLIYAGEIMSGGMEIIKPALAGDGNGSLGKMLICTVKDDLHDIGKNIVIALLEAAGFEVVDLGIDVPAEKVVETAKNEGIKIVALSGVLTLSLDSMKAVVDAFSSAGMRDSVKIIIGGAPVSEAACESIGADAWASSPQKTVEICKGWL